MGMQSASDTDRRCCRAFGGRRCAAQFAPIIIYDGKDDYSHLASLPSFEYTGDTHTNLCTTFSSIFHFFLNTSSRHVFLNGDWMFLSAILGIGSPSSHYPCPICTVKKDSLFTPSPLRTPSSAFASAFTFALAARTSPPSIDAMTDSHFSQRHFPLLAMLRDYIVPLPLHLFLGIGNHIIRLYPTLLGSSESVDKLVRKVKTYQTRASGAAQVFELNGVELSKWITHQMASKLDIPLLDIDDDAPLSSAIDTATPATIQILEGWIASLRTHLLHKRKWTEDEQQQFTLLVTTVQAQWTTVTHTPPFPKLHMLTHAVDFARQHQYLGKYSEAQIESYHASYARTYDITHRNQGGNVEERMRRALVDTILKQVC